MPGENLIGKVGDGFRQALRVLDGGRIGIAALSVGIAQGALDASLKYSKERFQFGKPLSEFQAVQWKLADMVTEIEAARALTRKAAWMKMNGRDINLAAAQAKYFSSEAAVRAANEAVQIHGGSGLQFAAHHARYPRRRGGRTFRQRFRIERPERAARAQAGARRRRQVGRHGRRDSVLSGKRDACPGLVADQLTGKPGATIDASGRHAAGPISYGIRRLSLEAA